MDVYAVIASPPKGHGEPWVSDLFSTLPLAVAYATAMQEVSEDVVYHVERYPLRTGLDVEVGDEGVESFPEGLRND
jgi:hypothetical protein